MTKGEMIEQLGNVPLFSGCSKKELATIASASKELTRKSGSMLAREGETGVGFFLITDGTANVIVGGRNRRKMGPGDFFGEISLLDGGPRSASVVADTDVQMLGLTAWVFRGILEQNPSIAQKMLVDLASRLRGGSKPSPTD
ncbi:MAG TPA: cyclic nucleotide-binding domain-containing protein [Actinomycetota bacterium]